MTEICCIIDLDIEPKTNKNFSHLEKAFTSFFGCGFFVCFFLKTKLCISPELYHMKIKNKQANFSFFTELNRSSYVFRMCFKYSSLGSKLKWPRDLSTCCE